jgi:hypothetical protein
MSWNSSKQKTIIDSTTKIEYLFMSEAIWIKKFIIKLGVVLSIVDLVAMYCDNNGSIA